MEAISTSSPQTPATNAKMSSDALLQLLSSISITPRDATLVWRVPPSNSTQGLGHFLKAVFDQEHPPPSSVWVVSSGQHQPHSDSKAKAALVKLTDSMERLRLDRQALGKVGSKKATTGAFIDTLAVVGTESGMGVGKWSAQQHGRERASSGSIVYKGWPMEILQSEEGPQMIVSLSQHLRLLIAHPESFSIADVHEHHVMFLGQGEALYRVCRPYQETEADFFLRLSMDQDILDGVIADSPRRSPPPSTSSASQGRHC